MLFVSEMVFALNPGAAIPPACPAVVPVVGFSGCVPGNIVTCALADWKINDPDFAPIPTITSRIVKESVVTAIVVAINFITTCLIFLIFKLNCVCSF
jgi:hypothetical protein